MPLLRESSRELGQGIGHSMGIFGDQGMGEEEPRVACLEGKQSLTLVAEKHQVGFPMAGSGSVVSFFGTQGKGLTQVNQGGGSPPLRPR